MTQIWDMEAIQGRGGKEGEGHTPEETPNNLISCAVARAVYVLGEGKMGCLVNGPASILIDNVPLGYQVTESGKTKWKYNFKGVSFETRNGKPDQDPFRNFTSTESETSLNDEITHALPVTKTISDTNLDDLRIKIHVPALYKVQKADGDMVGAKVTLKAWLSQDILTPVWKLAKTIIIKGKTNTSYERDVRIHDVSTRFGAGPWLLKLERVTADTEESNIANKTYLAGYTGIINEQFIFPDTCAVAVKLNAKQFGAHLPQISFDVRGINQIRIPNNYDPKGKTYSGTWSGTWATARVYTDNPVWCLLDLLTDTRYGLGVSISNVDKWSFYEAAQYCDELVPSGVDNETEPRFTFNACLQTQEDAYHVLNAIASSFLGMLYWTSGKVTLAIDSPKDASHLACPANVIGGEFNYSGTGLKSRHSAVAVTWNDPNDYYRPAVEMIEDPDMIQRYGLRQLDVMAMGCTRRSQAISLGKWILESENNETETVTFKGGFEFSDCVPGSIIEVQDPSYAGVRFGGRLRDGCTVSSLLLDSSVVLEEAVTYTVSVTMPDRAIESKVVTTSPGTHSTLALQTALSEAPNANSSWVLSASNLAPRKFRVLSNVEADKHQFEITALLHDSTKYDRVYYGLTLPETPVSIIPSGKMQPPVLEVENIKTFSYQLGRNFRLGVLLSWEASTDIRVMWYEIQFRYVAEIGEASPLAETAWKHLGDTSEPSVELRNIKPGIYDFRIRARGVGQSEWYELESVDIEDPNTLPPDITNLQIRNGASSWSGKRLEVTWDRAWDEDYFPRSRFKDYRVRVLKTDNTLIYTRYIQPNAEPDGDGTEEFIYAVTLMKKHFGGTVPRSFKIEVVARDIDLRKSGTPTVITVTKATPTLASQSPALAATNSKAYTVSIADTTLNPDDIEYYEIWARYPSDSAPKHGTWAPSSPPDPNTYVLAAKVSPENKDATVAYLLSTTSAIDVKVIPYDCCGAGTESDVVSATGYPSTIGGTSSQFNSTTGRTIAFGFSMGNTLYTVTIVPSEGPGDIGEIYVTNKAANSFVVKNSGSNTTALFTWTATRRD